MRLFHGKMTQPTDDIRRPSEHISALAFPDRARRVLIMPSAAKRHAPKRPAAARPPARPAARAAAKSARAPAAKPAAAKISTHKLTGKALPAPKPALVRPAAPAPRPPGSRAPGVFETKVLTALKRHGGAAVSFGTSPDHIKAAFKRCFAEGWATGTADSASLTPAGEKVLERLKPEIRAFPAPTLRNRLNDALFRNQNKAAVGPPPAANDAANAKGSPEEPDDDEPSAKAA
jgi:hypothetical protein